MLAACTAVIPKWLDTFSMSACFSYQYYISFTLMSLVLFHLVSLTLYPYLSSSTSQYLFQTDTHTFQNFELLYRARALIQLILHGNNFQFYNLNVKLTNIHYHKSHTQENVDCWKANTTKPGQIQWHVYSGQFYPQQLLKYKFQYNGILPSKLSCYTNLTYCDACMWKSHVLRALTVM